MNDAQYRPPIYLDEPSGLHYIVGKRNVLFDNGVIVPRSAFDSRASYRRTIRSLVEESAKNPDNCGWDFNNAVQTTNLAKTKTRRKTIIRPSIDDQVRTEAKPAQPELAEKKPEPIVTGPSSPEPKVEMAPAPEPAPEPIPEPAHPDTVEIMDVTGRVRLDPPKEPPAPKPAPKPTPEPEPVVEVPFEETRKKPNPIKAFFSVPYNDVILMILFVGALCVIMSVYHTFLFLIGAGKAPWVAAVTAVAMVTFSSTAYTIARRVAQDRKIGFFQRIFFALFLVAMGTFTIGFAVFSTINVSYGQFKAQATENTDALVQKSVIVTAQSDALGDIQKQIADADADVITYTRDRERFYELMVKPLPETTDPADPVLKAAKAERDAATRNYNAADKSLKAAKAARDALYAKKDSARTAHTEAVTTAVASDVTSYAAVAKRIGVSEDDFKFAIDTIPAVFFDIVAPFAIAVVMLLKDRRNGLTKGSLIDRLFGLLTKKLEGGK